MKKRAYAKINLALNVVGVESKMHLLDMIMSEIDLYDDIEIEKNDSKNISIDGMDFCKTEDNIMYKATKLFFEYCNIENGGVDIKIVKRIPHEAGLGGGSSDAMCVLKLLDKLYNTNLKNDDFYALSKKTGSDVSFFVRGGIARVGGVGHEIRHIKDEILNNMVIVKPPFGLSTKVIFEECDKERYIMRKDTIDEMEKCIKNGLEYKKYIFNDLEVVSKKVSDIGLYLEKLMQYDFENVFMTGSGSAIVCFKKKDMNYKVDELKKEFSECEIFDL